MRRLLAVLGQDVSKSLSPTLHRAAALRCGLDVAYVPVSCTDEGHFRRSVEALQTLGARGCNVTIPYKAIALEIADELGVEAREIGAVNTLTFEGTQIKGDNTDGPALVEVLSRVPAERRRKVQLLGAGGAARAVAWALAKLGSVDLVVCARDPIAAEQVAALCGGRSASLSPVEGADLLISALPKSTELAARSMSEWVAPVPSLWVVDLAYGEPGTDTPLVRAARSRGWTAYDGRSMLIEQAALALSAWTGGELSAIREAMRDALIGGEKSPGLL